MKLSTGSRLSLLPLYMHGFPQLCWGLHTSSNYIRSWVIWSPRWTVPIGLLVIGSAALFRGCLEQRRPPDKHLHGPQAELTIRGPCWVGPRHYCQLWMQSRPSVQGHRPSGWVREPGPQPQRRGNWEVEVWGTFQDSSFREGVSENIHSCFSHSGPHLLFVSPLFGLLIH